MPKPAPAVTIFVRRVASKPPAPMQYGSQPHWNYRPNPRSGSPEGPRETPPQRRTIGQGSAVKNAASIVRTANRAKPTMAARKKRRVWSLALSDSTSETSTHLATVSQIKILKRFRSARGSFHAAEGRMDSANAPRPTPKARDHNFCRVGGCQTQASSSSPAAVSAKSPPPRNGIAKNAVTAVSGTARSLSTCPRDTDLKACSSQMSRPTLRCSRLRVGLEDVFVPVARRGRGARRHTCTRNTHRRLLVVILRTGPEGEK